MEPLSQEEIDHMNGFNEWLKMQPKQSVYKTPIVVKVKRNSGIKELRDKGHKYFDMIWRDLKLIERNELYRSLAYWLNIDEEEAHFKFFNPNRCIEAIEFAIQHLNDDRRLDMDLTGIEPRPYFDLIIK
jgi:hypothetical protein